MASSLGLLMKAATCILDLSADYGGATRYLVRTYGYNICYIDFYKMENELNRKIMKEERLKPQGCNGTDYPNQKAP